ncbi:hypothetical protein [Mycolicibacterium fortuitum]|uniref:hypothetical protein n=1 Tax=Mycolicibacterium fortuitum TaxID=1766 RepID=UPI003AAEEDC6
MRARLAQLVWRWRQIPGRTRLGMVIAAVAIAGLAWQHYTTPDSAPGAGQPSVAESSDDAHAGHDHGDDGHAHGEYQPDPSTMAPPPDYSPEAARLTVERFASNFASPNGNHDDWLTRIGADVMPELLDQYRLTDVRNIPQTTVTQVNGPMASNPAAPTFEVAYGDGASVEVTLEMDLTGWKVSSVVPVEAAPPAALAPGPAVDPAVPAPSPEPASPVIGASPVSEVG